MEDLVCKFCGKNKKLIKAHIIPRQFYIDYKKEKYVSVNAKTGKAIYQQCGGYDSSILCEDCDSGILRNFENEGYKILRMNLLSHMKIVQNDLIIYELTKKDFNYDLLRKFFISIIWRASISKLKEWSNINLGPYESKALDILKNKKDYNNLFHIVIYKGNPIPDFNKILMIGKVKFLNIKPYIIQMAGFSIIVIVNRDKIFENYQKQFKNFFMSKDLLWITESKNVTKSICLQYSENMERIKDKITIPKPKL